MLSYNNIIVIILQTGSSAHLWLTMLIFILSHVVFSADCETGEDVVCALRERRAPPGSAGLGQSAVGGHVWSKTAHKSARQSGITTRGRAQRMKFVCVCVYTDEKFVSLFSLCTQSGPITLVALSQELGSDCTHSSLWKHRLHNFFLQIPSEWSVPCFFCWCHVAPSVALSWNERTERRIWALKKKKRKKTWKEKEKRNPPPSLVSFAKLDTPCLAVLGCSEMWHHALNTRLWGLLRLVAPT